MSTIADCPLCGDTSHYAIEMATKLGLLVAGAAVCDACAERVSNAWHYAHSGRWLSYQNAPSDKRKKAIIGAELRTSVFERDLYRCRRCSTHLQLTADHIVAESKGGPTTLDNLQTLCRSCNSRKGARDDA